MPVQPTVSDLAPSIIRTLVPIIVGAVGGYEATYLGATPAQQTAIATVAAGGLYYLLVRLLEHRWPALGVLLGVPSAPVYRADLTPVIEAAAERAVAAALARQSAAPAVAVVTGAPPTVALHWSDLVPPPSPGAAS